jgi:hypothetical protein
MIDYKSDCYIEEFSTLFFLLFSSSGSVVGILQDEVDPMVSVI